MFEDLFKKFVKYEIQPIKQKEELEMEFGKIKQEYAQIATSQVYQLLKQYYLTRIELNRDILEALNVADDANLHKILAAQAENKVIRDFIADIEDMQLQTEAETI